MKTSTLLATIVVVTSTAFAQSQPQLPANMKAPPGYEIKMGEPVMNYSFVGYSRFIQMDVRSIGWTQAEAGAQVKVTDKPEKPTPKLKKIIADPTMLVPGFEAPSKISYVGLSGKDGGTIMFLEYTNKLPDNARKLVNKALHGSESDPAHAPDLSDEALVTDNFIVVWSFKNAASKAKTDHQKKTLSAVGAAAQAWEAAHPVEAKKLREENEAAAKARAAKEAAQAKSPSKK